MNVTLIGMPGSGKSAIGKLLAKTLDFSFVDPDKLLEQQFEKPLQEVLTMLGEEDFLRAEADLSVDALLHTKDVVLATGGSIVYSTDAMREIAARSVIVYLSAPFEEIERRVGTTPRGIVGLDKHTLRELYDERTPLYEQWAGVTIDATRSPDKVVSDIFAHLEMREAK
jgi:shikimate kinase